MPGADAGAAAELVNELAAGVEYMHAVVARVGDGDAVAGRGKVDGTRRIELPAAERECELYGVAAHAILTIVEHLHAVVARVGDGDAVAAPLKCGGARAVELPVAGAG